MKIIINEILIFACYKILIFFIRIKSSGNSTMKLFNENLRCYGFHLLLTKVVKLTAIFDIDNLLLITEQHYCASGKVFGF